MGIKSELKSKLSGAQMVSALIIGVGCTALSVARMIYDTDTVNEPINHALWMGGLSVIGCVAYQTYEDGLS